MPLLRGGLSWVFEGELLKQPSNCYLEMNRKCMSWVTLVCVKFEGKI